MSIPTTTTTDPQPGPDETFDPASTEGLDDYLVAEGLREVGNPVEGTEDEGQQSAGRGPNAEAARWRASFREAEAERDGLRERVTNLQRREVERLAEGKLAQAGDLLTYGEVTLDDLLDADGHVDAGAVEQAVAGLLAARPGLRYLPPGPSSFGLGYTRPIPRGEPETFAQAVRKTVRGG
ncbi:hypothetical protein [Kineococcus aurantiacus]|uniref:Uncharacterized protein n=1 Tax=Kineococcus aurantiacus TaxID=37633 RepID=A0A7Y9DHG7_9ACTN|nr:hypothetical protein [Kineococcus aurantiacus]NYD21371.1 hypothetical protein [Kineococcus aurantiacus]